MDPSDLDAAIAGVCAATRGVRIAFLFGSHASGRPHRDSDVDVGVVTDRRLLPDRSSRFDLRVQLSSDLAAALHHNQIDVVILDDAPALFARQVLRTGRLLWSSDEDSVRQFTRQTQLRAADIEPAVLRGRKTAAEVLAR
ncbi:hypothetical protein BH23ACT9_BH23ACT9_12280 [soil metagenome]